VIPTPDMLDEHALRRLLDAGRSLVSDLELDGVLDRLLHAAADVTGARYAALGILGPGREQLERFVTLGADHMPPAEPCLDVPVLIRGEAWGNLHLADKPEPFTQADADAVAVLAAWAAVAIENARLYQDSERRREELEGAVRRLEATTAIALAVGGETDLGRVLDLIARHGLDLVRARGVAILLREENGLVFAAEAGEVPSSAHGACIEGGVGRVRTSLGLAGADGVLVPLVFRGRSLGMLAAFGPFSGSEDERLLRSFAASAATAVATARTVEEQRLRGALQAAEAERARWARELHDETLQSLGALRMLLVATRRSGDVDHVAIAIERLEEEIDSLRGLIRDLRPAALDELGLGAAIEGLAERTGRRGVVHVGTDVDLPLERFPAEIEVAVYRLVQEALANAVRHASAQRVSIKVEARDDAIHADVHDDGDGFDPNAPADGFGLIGMRERVALLRGELEISSSAGGTHVSAAIPLSSGRG
jgi:signal transduction histidine kinase